MQRWAFSFITSNDLVPHITTSQLEVTCGPSAQPLLFLPGLQTATENLNLCNTCIEDMGWLHAKALRGRCARESGAAQGRSQGVVATPPPCSRDVNVFTT